jgi:hypothetical protein
VIGLAALAVAAFAGGAYAATQTSGPSTRQAFLNDVAKRLHVTPQQLNQALTGALADQLQAAVKAGQLTQAEADKLQQRLKEGGLPPALPFGFFGFRGRLAHPWLPGLFPPVGGPGELGAAASYLGLTDTQLLQQIAGGESLAQIATAHGKSVSGLEHAMLTAQKTMLDKLRAAKVITAAQEQKIIARFKARVAAQVNRKGLFRRVFPPRLRFPYGVPAPPLNAPVPPAYAPPDALPAPSA